MELREYLIVSIPEFNRRGHLVQFVLRDPSYGLYGRPNGRFSSFGDLFALYLKSVPEQAKIEPFEVRRCLCVRFADIAGHRQDLLDDIDLDILRALEF